MNCLANALVGAAATDVPGHCGVYIGVGGLRLLTEQCRRRHYLTRLAITALGDIPVQPGRLHRMEGISPGQPLNSGYGFAHGTGSRHRTALR